MTPLALSLLMSANPPALCELQLSGPLHVLIEGARLQHESVSFADGVNGPCAQHFQGKTFQTPVGSIVSGTLDVRRHELKAGEHGIAFDAGGVQSILKARVAAAPTVRSVAFAYDFPGMTTFADPATPADGSFRLAVDAWLASAESRALAATKGSDAACGAEIDNANRALVTNIVSLDLGALPASGCTATLDDPGATEKMSCKVAHLGLSSPGDVSLLLTWKDAASAQTVAELPVHVGLADGEVAVPIDWSRALFVKCDDGFLRTTRVAIDRGYGAYSNSGKCELNIDARKLPLASVDLGALRSKCGGDHAALTHAAKRHRAAIARRIFTVKVGSATETQAMLVLIDAVVDALEQRAQAEEALRGEIAQAEVALHAARAQRDSSGEEEERLHRARAALQQIVNGDDDGVPIWASTGYRFTVPTTDATVTVTVDGAGTSFSTTLRRQDGAGIAPFEGRPGARFYATVPLMAVGLRSPASTRELTSSRDGLLVQPTFGRTGLLVVVEPWDDARGANPWPAPVQFWLGSHFLHIDSTKPTFRPVFVAGAGLTLPLFGKDAASTSIAFGANVEYDPDVGFGALLTTDIQLLKLLSPPEGAPNR